MSSVAHIHFGPGQLGLGLVVPAGIAAGLPVHLIARRDAGLESTCSFELRVATVEADPLTVKLPVASLSQASQVQDLDPRAQQTLVEADDVLLTTALTTSGLQASRPLILATARRRKDHPGSTVFIAAENDPGDDDGSFAQALRALGVDVRETMVDRLCFFQDKKLDKQPARRLVTAAHFAEWLIEGEPTTETLTALEATPTVTFVPEVRPHELRKRWLVNGAHLALALSAHDHNEPRLWIRAAEPGCSEWLGRMQGALAKALEAEGVRFDDNPAYTSQQTSLWKRHEDYVPRVLRRLRRLDLLPFIVDVQRKLGDPASRYRERVPEPSPEFEAVFEVLHGILCSVEKYVDFARLETLHELGQPVPLSAEQDTSVIEAYGGLLSGVCDSGTKVKRIRQLTRALARDRDRYS